MSRGANQAPYFDVCLRGERERRRRRRGRRWQCGGRLRGGGGGQGGAPARREGGGGRLRGGLWGRLERALPLRVHLHGDDALAVPVVHLCGHLLLGKPAAVHRRDAKLSGVGGLEAYGDGARAVGGEALHAFDGAELDALEPYLLLERRHELLGVGRFADLGLVEEVEEHHNPLPIVLGHARLLGEGGGLHGEDVAKELPVVLLQRRLHGCLGAERDEPVALLVARAVLVQLHLPHLAHLGEERVHRRVREVGRDPAHVH
mmetsp:Transcript_24282/g.56462  ORF Transcript_24282/g.56462 Transcript_24282/m.56462 type:complete len:260 (-) Transcript_24282:347-1126(-)